MLPRHWVGVGILVPVQSWRWFIYTLLAEEWFSTCLVTPLPGRRDPQACSTPPLLANIVGLVEVHRLHAGSCHP